MGIKSLCLSLLACPALVLGGVSTETIKERMLRDLDFIRNTFEVKYAPAEWKRRYSGWDLETEIERAKDFVRYSDEVSIKSYQHAVREFILSTKDYHVGVHFWSTEWAALPFRVCGADGKYFITFIDRARLPARSFPFKVGDELVKFDGRPTNEVIQELKAREVGDASPLTDQALAEIYLTRRSGAAGLIVPRGPVTITVASGETNKLSSYQIIWDYSPERIKDTPIKSLTPDVVPASTALADHSFFKKKLHVPHLETLNKSYPNCACEDPNDIGARRSFIPDLGPKRWESDPSDPFHAYLFEAPDGRLIGYVRIPHYHGGALEVQAFARTIAYLEENSEALVLDQVNNPGGSVFYMYALASLLTQQPLYTPKHRTTLTQEDVAFALEYERVFECIRSDSDARLVLGDTMEGYPITYQTSQFMLNFFRFIMEEWNDGRTLTRPYYLYGVDCINPHPGVRYSKPILLLVNHLCFSGGDFLPAIFQDNRTLTIFGSKTAGAGGYVDGCSFQNIFGVAEINFTASLAERIDKNPIENLGVTPDIRYDLTEDDLKDDFHGYVEAVLEAVKEL